MRNLKRCIGYARITKLRLNVEDQGMSIYNYTKIFSLILNNYKIDLSFLLVKSLLDTQLVRFDEIDFPNFCKIINDYFPSSLIMQKNNTYGTVSVKMNPTIFPNIVNHFLIEKSDSNL